MNWKRIARSLVCLLVICALVLNISPVRAKAFTGEYILYKTLEVVLYSILIGLGVGFVEDVVLPSGEGFMDALSDFVTLNYPYVTDDMKVRVYDTSFSGNSDFPYAVDADLIELVRQWLFDNGILSVSQAQTLGSGFTIDGDKGAGVDFWRSVSLYDTFAGVNSGFLLMCCTDRTMSSKGYWGGIYVDTLSYSVPVLRLAATSSISPYTSADYPLSSVVEGLTMYRTGDSFFCRNYDDASAVYASTGKMVYYLTLDTVASEFCDGSVLSSQNVYMRFVNMGCIASNGQTSTTSLYMYSWTSSGYTYTYPLSPNFTSSDVVTSDYALTLGAVALPSLSLAEGYSVWSGNSISVPGDVAGVDSDVLALPIIWGGTLTQEDVWYGELDSTADEPVVDDGTVARTPWKTFVDALTDFIVTPILNGIKAIFVPSEDFLTTKVESLRSRFGFVDSVINTGDAIRAALTDFETSPPIIYMELSNAESKYDWGDRAIALDLRWYERYKPMVDQLLSAMLWLWFAWRVFRKLPDIISGVAGDVPDGRVAEGPFLRVGYAEDHKRLPPGKS